MLIIINPILLKRNTCIYKNYIIVLKSILFWKHFIPLNILLKKIFSLSIKAFCFVLKAIPSVQTILTVFVQSILWKVLEGYLEVLWWSVNSISSALKRVKQGTVNDAIFGFNTFTMSAQNTRWLNQMLHIFIYFVYYNNKINQKTFVRIWDKIYMMSINVKYEMS